jgi:hypothetical protein
LRTDVGSNKCGDPAKRQQNREQESGQTLSRSVRGQERNAKQQQKKSSDDERPS